MITRGLNKNIDETSTIQVNHKIFSANSGKIFGGGIVVSK